MLAPLLLLLSQDPLMLPNLEEHQRYFPPTLAVTAYLSAAAILQVSRYRTPRNPDVAHGND